MLSKPRRHPQRLATRPSVSSPASAGEAAHMTIDLQDMLDDPSSGGGWDWPLRLIARWHCAIDVHAPRLFRVNRQFEYCWRLAVKTNEIDLRAHRLRISKQPVLQYERWWPHSVPKKDEHTTPVFLLSETSARRKSALDAWRMRGFEVTLTTCSQVADVTYSGAFTLNVPADAVIQGAGAAAGH